MPEATIQTNEEMENFGFPEPVFYENILNTPKNLEDISQNCGGWTIKEGKLYYDGATDALSSGMAPLDFPFYAGSKYDMRAVAPFRVTPAGKVFCSDMNIAGGAISGGTIGGVPVANIAIVGDTNADAVPTGLVVSSTGITTAPDGTQSAYVVLTWTANAESNFDHYLIRYKKHSYTYYTYLIAGTNTITIDGLVPNNAYDFGLATVNKYGIQSSFCTDVNSTTGTDSTAPATVTAGSATGGIQYNLIEWTHNTETDLASYNIFRSETNNSATGVLIANVRTNYFIDGNRVGGTTYYYWIKAKDTSGNVSAAFSTVKSATPRNVTSDDIVTIAGSKVLIDGAVYLSNWRHSGDLTKIDGGDIYANSVTLTQLNFTPVQTTDVIARINASAEGITIEADNLTINAATTFGAGYNPNTALLTAQEKAQVFTAEPTTPYYVDDLWANGTVLKKCGTQRLTGAYNAADWALATGYTDDTVANSKIKTFIQDTVPTSISSGDFWINTAVSSIGNNMLYRATNAGDTTIAAGHWVAVPDNNKLGGTGSAATGGSYDSAASGARVRLFPDANTGLQIIDDAGNDVFKAMVGGTSVGDIIFGDYAHDQGMFYDKSVGAHGTTYVKGALIGGAGSVFSADYFSGGIITGQDIELKQSTIYAASAIIDSYSETTRDSSMGLYSGNNIGIGQSFTNSNSNRLDKVKFYIERYGNPSGNVTATIYAHTGTYGTDGKPTGAVLATSDAVNVATVSDSNFVLTEFIFSGANEITLSAGIQYIAVINFSGGDSSNNLMVGMHGTSPTHSGNASYSTNLSSWSALSTDYDLCFYVYGEQISSGDCAIRAGKTGFNNNETGWIAGIDGNDGNKPKLIIGTPTEYLAVLGDTMVNTLKIGGYDVGDVQLIASDAAKYAAAPTTPTLMKSIQLGRPGNYRVSFQARAVNSQPDSRNAHFYLTKQTYSPTTNYLAMTTIGISGNADSGYIDYASGGNAYIDVSNLVYGDTLYLWGYADGGVACYVQNYKIKVAALNEVVPPSVTLA